MCICSSVVFDRVSHSASRPPLSACLNWLCTRPSSCSFGDLETFIRLGSSVRSKLPITIAKLVPFNLRFLPIRLVNNVAHCTPGERVNETSQLCDQSARVLKVLVAAHNQVVLRAHRHCCATLTVYQILSFVTQHIVRGLSNLQM